MEDEFIPDIVRVINIAMDKTLSTLSQIISRNYRSAPFSTLVKHFRENYRNYKNELKLTEEDQRYTKKKDYERILFKRFWEIIFTKTNLPRHKEYKREMNPYSLNFGKINKLANDAGAFLRILALRYYHFVTLDKDIQIDEFEEIARIDLSHTNLISLDFINFVRPHLMELYGSFFLLQISEAAKLRLAKHFLLLLPEYLDYVYAGGGRGYRSDLLPMKTSFTSFDDIHRVRSYILRLAKLLPSIKVKTAISHDLQIVHPIRSKKGQIISLLNQWKTLDPDLKHLQSKHIKQIAEDLLDQSRQQGDYLHYIIPRLQGVGQYQNLRTIKENPHTFVLRDTWLYSTEIPISHHSYSGYIDGVLFYKAGIDVSTTYPIAIIERKTLRAERGRIVGSKKSGSQFTPHFISKIRRYNQEALIQEASWILHNSSHPHWEQLDRYSSYLMDEWQDLLSLDNYTPHQVILLEDQSLVPNQLAVHEMKALNQLIDTINCNPPSGPVLYQGPHPGIILLFKPGSEIITDIISQPSIMDEPPMLSLLGTGMNLIPVFQVNGLHQSGAILSHISSLRYLVSEICKGTTLLLDISGFLDKFVSHKLQHVFDKIPSRIKVKSYNFLLDEALPEFDLDVYDNIIVIGWDLVKQTMTLKQQAVRGFEILKAIQHSAQRLYWLDTPLDGPSHSSLYMSPTKIPWLNTENVNKYSFYAQSVSEIIWNMSLPPIAPKTRHPIRDDHRIFAHMKEDKMDFHLFQIDDVTDISIKFSNPSRYSYVKNKTGYLHTNQVLDAVLSLLPWIPQVYPTYQIDRETNTGQVGLLDLLIRVPSDRTVPPCPLIYDKTLPIPPHSNYVDADQITKGFTPRKRDKRLKVLQTQTFLPLPLSAFYNTMATAHPKTIYDKEILYMRRVTTLLRNHYNDDHPIHHQLLQTNPRNPNISDITNIASIIERIIDDGVFSHLTFLQSSLRKFHINHINHKSQHYGIGSWLILLIAGLCDPYHLSKKEIEETWYHHRSWLYYQLGFKISDKYPILVFSLPDIARQISRLAIKQSSVSQTDLITFDSVRRIGLLVGDAEFYMGIEQHDGSVIYGRFPQIYKDMVLTHGVDEFSMGLSDFDLSIISDLGEETPSIHDYDYYSGVILESNGSHWLVIESEESQESDDHTHDDTQIVCSIDLQIKSDNILDITRVHITPRSRAIEIPASYRDTDPPGFGVLFDVINSTLSSTHEVKPTLSIDTLRQQVCISFVKENPDEKNNPEIIHQEYFTEVHEIAYFLKSCQYNPDRIYVTDFGLSLTWSVYDLSIDGSFPEIEGMIASLAQSKSSVIRNSHEQGDKFVGDLLRRDTHYLVLTISHDDDYCDCSDFPTPASIETCTSEEYRANVDRGKHHDGIYLTSEDIASFQDAFGTQEDRVYLDTADILHLIRSGNKVGENSDKGYEIEFEIDTDQKMDIIMREDYYLLKAYQRLYTMLDATLLKFNSHKVEDAASLIYQQYDAEPYVYQFVFYDLQIGKYIIYSFANSNSPCQLMNELEDAIEEFTSSGEILGLTSDQIKNLNHLEIDLEKIEEEAAEHRTDCRICQLPEDVDRIFVDHTLNKIEGDDGIELECISQDDKGNLYPEILVEASDHEDFNRLLIGLLMDVYTGYIDLTNSEEDAEESYISQLEFELEDRLYPNLGSVVTMSRSIIQELDEDSQDDFRDLFEASLLDEMEGYLEESNEIATCHYCDQSSIISQGLHLCEEHFQEFQEEIEGDGQFVSINDWEVRDIESRYVYWIEQFAEEGRLGKIEILKTLYTLTAKQEMTSQVRIYQFKLKVEQARLFYREDLFETALVCIDVAMSIYYQEFDKDQQEIWYVEPPQIEGFWGDLDHSLFSCIFYQYENYTALAEVGGSVGSAGIIDDSGSMETMGAMNPMNPMEYYHKVTEVLKHARLISKEGEPSLE